MILSYRMNKIYILCYIMWSNVVVNGKGIIICNLIIPKLLNSRGFIPFLILIVLNVSVYIQLRRMQVK